MSPLSKKTKSQLLEIAEDLEIDISDCKVKKDILELLNSYFQATAGDFDENSKYYELASLFSLETPKPTTTIIQSDDEDVKEVNVIEEPTEEGEEDTEAAEGSEVSESEEDEDDEDDDYDDDITIEDFTTLSRALKKGFLPEYIDYKNYQIQDYLTDPYSINELSFYIETAVLIYSLVSFDSLDKYLPNTILKYVPKCCAQKLSVISYQSFNVANLSTLFLWAFTGRIFPKILSYYINFTYDFETDAFTESLSKLFLAILVFKTDVGISSVKDELKYGFSLGNMKIETFKHFLFVATISLREVFGNWVLVDALFTSILALYANLVFV